MSDIHIFPTPTVTLHPYIGTCLPIQRVTETITEHNLEERCSAYILDITVILLGTVGDFQQDKKTAEKQAIN